MFVFGRAVDLVRLLEACKHVALKKPFSAQSHRSYQESSDENQDLKQMIADLSRAVSNTGLMRDNRRQSDVNNGPLCFNCGLTGHIARSCPSKTSEEFKRTSKVVCNDFFRWCPEAPSEARWRTDVSAFRTLDFMNQGPNPIFLMLMFQISLVSN